MFKPEEWNLDGRQKALACVLLMLASLLIYSPSLNFGFTKYDDYRIIGEHPQLYVDGTAIQRIKQIAFLDFPREEPLIVRDLSWLIDSIVFGYNRPFGYHYGNVIYHSVVLVLAFLLILRLTNATTALISSSLLLVLAVHSEPVAWIMGRKDLLSAMFSLFSILAFLYFQESRSTWPKTLAYLGSLLFASAAFFSKINAVILPGIIFLCALAAQPGLMRDGFAASAAPRIIATRVGQVVPFLILGVAVLFWYRAALGNYGLFDRTLEYSTEDVWRLVFVVNPLILLEYLKIVFIPWNLEAYYTSPSVFDDFSRVQMAMAVAFLAAIAALVVILWKINRVSCLLFLCFLIAMLPYANWENFGFWYANRYVYFASIFVAAAFVSLGVEVWRRTDKAHLRAIPPLILCWVLLQNIYYRIDYLFVWENGESLWEHEVSLPNASIHDYNHLTANYIGRAEDSQGQTRAEWLDKARLINDQVFDLQVPEHERVWLPLAHYYKGLILAYTNAPLEAQLEQFLTALHSSSGFSKAEWSTAVVYYQMALEETDPIKRQALARESLVYAQHFFETSERGPQIHFQEQEYLRGLKMNFPDISVPEEFTKEP